MQLPLNKIWPIRPRWLKIQVATYTRAGHSLRTVPTATILFSVRISHAQRTTPILMIQGMCNLKYPPALYIRKWSNLDYRDTRSGRERNPKNSSGAPTSSSQNWIRCGISLTCCTRTMTWPLMSRSMEYRHTRNASEGTKIFTLWHLTSKGGTPHGRELRRNPLGRVLHRGR